MKDMNLVIVFPSKEAERYVMRDVLSKFKKEGYNDVVEFYKSAKKSVRPDLYEKYKVRLTPTIVLFYKDDKKTLWQPILSGQISITKLRKATMNFLKYNDIVNPGEMGADKNWNSPEKPILKSLTKIPELKKAIDFDSEDKRLNQIEEEDKE